MTDRSRQRCGLAGAALLGLLAATPLSAQQAPDTVRLDELVVTATRLPRSREASPLSTSVVTGAELRARGIRTVADALRTLPGAAVVQPGPFGGVTSLFVRGGESDYVKVLVDGVPVNAAGGAFDFANLSTVNVERIEVVRGPGSVLYGSDAVTGVVQIFTRDGGKPRLNGSYRRGWAPRFDAPEAAADGHYGTGAWNVDLSSGRGSTRYSVGYGRFDTDGGYAFNGGHVNTTLSGRLSLRPDSASDLAFTLRRTAGVFHFPTDGGGHVLDRNQFNRNEAWTLGLDGGTRLSNRVEARVLLASNTTNATFGDAPDSPADTLGFYASASEASGYRRSADVRLNIRPRAATIVTLGAVLEREHERSSSSYSSQFGPGADSADVRREDRGYYAQLLTEAGPLALTAGARLDDSDRFGRFTTWRAGATLHPFGGTRLRAAAGTAFKEPTFYENFARGFVRGNPDLAPERSRSWEVGAEQRLSHDHLALQATYFAQRFRDLIQYRGDAPADEPSYVNLGGARADGLEATAELTAANGRVHVAAGYTHLDTKVTREGAGGDPTFVAGQRLVRRPANSGFLTGSWARPAGGALSATITRVGERDDIDYSDPSLYPAPRVRLPAYTRVDVSGELPVWPMSAGRLGLVLTAAVENLFDQSYRDIANFPARGRTIYVGARVGTGY
ncbi:MAG: TonB-dependent receptor [Gemmatimonadetes bacterium]|nr:TonB-dependent receptor [Gemmatimonadota bacterium]